MRDWYFIAEQPAPAPHLAHLEACAALRIVLLTVPRVSLDLEPVTLSVETPPEREFFIDNLLVRIHFIIVVIWWTGFAPWDFGFPFPGSQISTVLFPFPGSLTSTFLL